MRLSFFHSGFQGTGGAEVLAAMQARQLRALGDEVSLLTFAFDARRWGAAFEGIPVELVPKRHWTDLFSFWDPVRKVQARGARAVARLRGAEAVLAHNTPCHAILGRSGLPLLKAWYCHEPPRTLYPRETNPRLARAAAEGVGDFPELMDKWLAREGRAGGARKAFDREGVAGLDLLIANSAFCRDNARKVYGRDDIEVLHPMVRFEAEPPARSGIDRAGLRLLVHSRLERVKNVDTVIRGFARFRERVPGSRLHVVGEGGHRPELERLAAELGLGAAASFHGFLPEAELREVYAACDAMALLPLDEPFGLVFPEAMARGLLVVGPDHGGPVEILDGGRLGWTCEALDPEALAEALMALWRTPDAELDRRRAEADAACRARFSPEVVGARLRQLLHRNA